MWDTPGRLLRLLELLQVQRDWSATELAEKLGVSTRTVRRDIARLRDIGYQVDAQPGIDGGYHLMPGTSLPPLMFDAEEAVATVLALQTSSLSGAEVVAGSALRALTKLTSVMPPRLRREVDALTSQTSHTSHGTIIGQPTVDVDVNVLITAALACRERRQATARYRSPQGEPTERSLEPFRLVRAGGRWYLVAWDLDRHDWRTFRVDRFRQFEPTKRPSADRTPPSDDIEAYVVDRIGVGMQRHRGVVRVHAPHTAVRHWIDPAWGRVEDLGDDKCVLHVGADSLAAVARWLLLLDADLTVLDPPALAAEFAALAGRATRAADSLRPNRPNHCRSASWAALRVANTSDERAAGAS